MDADHPRHGVNFACLFTDWAIFDQCFSTRDPFYLSTTKKIVERSEWWAKRWNQTPEMVIKHMFRFAFATGIGRKRVLGIRRAVNNNWKR